MKYSLLLCCFFFSFTAAHSQFQPTDNGLTIIVTDGTEKGKHSETSKGGDIPTSYEQVGGRAGAGARNSKTKTKSPKNSIVFNDPIRELGMRDCIQAAAFLERPKYGKLGFMLIFSINDSIGGQQATLLRNGKTYKGVYRLIRQKTSSKEIVPKGMTTYDVIGTFFLLGIS